MSCGNVSVNQRQSREGVACLEQARRGRPRAGTHEFEFQVFPLISLSKGLRGRRRDHTDGKIYYYFFGSR